MAFMWGWAVILLNGSSGRYPAERFKHLYQADYYRAYFEQLLTYDRIDELIGNGRARQILEAALKGYHVYS